MRIYFLNKWNLGELLEGNGDGEQHKIKFTTFVLWSSQVLALTKWIYFKVSIHPSFILIKIVNKKYIKDGLPVHLLSIYESVSVLLVSSVCSLDSTYKLVCGGGWLRGERIEQNGKSTHGCGEQCADF